MDSTDPPAQNNSYLERILRAQVYDVAIESPLEVAKNLSRALDNQVWLKREDLQSVFSFKLRGAYNRIRLLSAAELDRGVVTASAGNHAQGVALAAQRRGCRAVIVMPGITPAVKVRSVSRLGAEVVLHGNSFDDACSHAQKLVEEQGLCFIHAFDDPEVIAGQGTIGMEILRQMAEPPAAIYVAVGGGGLISGIAAYVKALWPHVEIIGVEPVDSDSMTRSLAAGRRVCLDQVGIFADGVAVRQVGEETFRLCRQYVDHMVLVDTDAICAAIKDVFEDTRSVLEPSGALAIAGLKQDVVNRGRRNQQLVAVACGANMNFDRLRFVAERAELGAEREALLAVTIPERPGSLLRFCAVLGNHNLTEFSYRMADPQQAHIFIGVEVNGRDDTDTLVQKLQEGDFATVNLSDDELSKVHIRHMVGGRCPAASGELLYRFEFPERPGALMHFVSHMRPNWNLSMFHYRNQGSDHGRIVVAAQVPETERQEWQAFLQTLGYRYWDETGNQAYQLFLG
ncbi:MAG: threonine dehydratase [Candidatus Synechococcus spongiarum 15L]|uniref:L-threonine dehydratase n=1 Tax=Candidatus Synechococcus spongiarum 15L TaxID=1608419 RepID=A0A0G8AVD0_9SYNE|nr:MAG: threonine dehydratase [Candidatus Synechococcus spongiarum 15L]